MRWSLSAPARARCATTDEGKAVTYSLTAKQNYDKGLAELKDENYPEATRYFSFVKQKFPFSKYAVLAELALADTQFARGNYQEAIDAYKNFARLHPTHEKVEDGYVALQDLRVLRAGDAGRLLPGAALVREGSDGGARRLPRAVGLHRQVPRLEVPGRRQEACGARCCARLIEHEVYVARFYLDRDHPKAAILRLEAALRRYPDRGARPSCCWRWARPTCRWATPLQAKETFEQGGQRATARTHQAKRARAVPGLHPQAATATIRRTDAPHG